MSEVIEVNAQQPKSAQPEVVEDLSDEDRKSTRLNSSHLVISYAVFCLKKKKNYTYIIYEAVLINQVTLVSISASLHSPILSTYTPYSSRHVCHPFISTSVFVMASSMTR